MLAGRMAASGMEGMQAELKGAKTRWGPEIELSKADKGTPGYPFPVSLTRYVPKPESAACWDVEELPLRLCFHSADREETPVSAEVAPLFPSELIDEIEKAVEKEWKRKLKKKADDSRWFVEYILEWVETKYGDLLRLVPSQVESYIGCDDTGASMRRYVVVEPAEEGDDDDEDIIDPEEQARRVAEYVAREEKRLQDEYEAQEAEAALKKKMALDGIEVDGPKTRQLSKKEREELNPSRKDKSGHRWRKTASKSHKPTKEEEKAGKK